VLRFIDKSFKVNDGVKSTYSNSSYYGRHQLAIKTLTRQKLLSLNVGKSTLSSRTALGYPDPVFKQHLSRGYVAVNPMLRTDHEKISDFGPFYKKSPTVTHVG